MPLGMRVTACFNIFVMKYVRNFVLGFRRGLEFGGGYRSRSTQPTFTSTSGRQFGFDVLKYQNKIF